jgi:Mor family transcriptional regulator
VIASRLKLTIGQINGLSSFIEKTDGKREYRRAVAVFQKADGKTYDYIAREHRVHIRNGFMIISKRELKV